MTPTATDLLVGIDAYRIWPGRASRLFRGRPRRRHPDRWRRSWQAEWPDAPYAVRAWTRDGAVIKALRHRKALATGGDE